MIRKFPLLLCAMAAFPLSANAIPADAAAPGKSDVNPPKIQKICDTSDKLAPPAKDLPTEEEKKTLKCDKDYYYGSDGTQVDYALARKCGFILGDSHDQYFTGSEALMMLYANGYGVEKNIDLAIKYVCHDGNQIESRINHLNDIRNLKPGQQLAQCVHDTQYPVGYCEGKFDTCDDVESGEMEGVCAGRNSAIAEQKNKAAFNQNISVWPEADRAAFAVLEKTARDYVTQHAAAEIDLSGSGRGAFEVEEEDKLIKQFRDGIIRMDKGTWPAYAVGDFAKADVALNKIYAQVMKKAPKDYKDGNTVIKDGIRKTEIAWLAYRDAWVKFAQVHYANHSADEIKTFITKERIAELKELKETLQYLQ